MITDGRQSEQAWQRGDREQGDREQGQRGLRAHPPTGATHPLVRDVLAAGLGQLGYAVLPPRAPEAVAPALAEAAQGAHRQAGEGAAAQDDDWAPCLLVVQGPRRSGQANVLSSIWLG